MGDLEEPVSNRNHSLSSVFDDASPGDSRQSFVPGSTSTTTVLLGLWDQTVQNISRTVTTLENEEDDVPLLLSVRLVVIAAVIAGISILAWGSYALHRRRLRRSKRDVMYASALL